eukprot:12947-Rhodomonas_salina.2
MSCQQLFPCIVAVCRLRLSGEPATQAIERPMAREGTRAESQRGTLVDVELQERAVQGGTMRLGTQKEHEFSDLYFNLANWDPQ